MADLLGVHSQTGQPIGSTPIVASPMNIVGAIGRFNRIFDKVMILDGETDRDFLIGAEPQAGKLGWYILNDAIEKASPKSIKFKFKSFKGSGAATASSTLLDQAGTALSTLTLSAAYRGQPSFGVYDNKIGYTITNVSRLTYAITAITGAAPTSIVLNSVIGIVVGDQLKITHSSVDYGFKVTAINEATNTLTGTPQGTMPALAVSDAVNVMNFKITSWFKDYRGQITKVNTAMNDKYLSMESEATDYYVNNVLAAHPLFAGASTNSATTFYKRNPADITTPVFLAGGLDGAAPSTTSDWTNMQNDFDDLDRLCFFITTDTTLTAVHQSFAGWVAGRLDFPLYTGQLPDFADDWQSLKAYGQDYVVRVGWKRIGLFYGYRYVADPIGNLKKIPTYGGVIGKWINVIYNGQAHHAVSEYAYPFTYLTGSETIYEDSWNDTVRTALFNAGINIMNFVSGYGIILRNFRSPSDDVRTRDLHRFVLDQIIKFTAEDNLRTSENKPAKFRELKFMRTQLEYGLLKPMFDGTLDPFVIAQSQGDGAFIDVLDNGDPANFFDVTKVISDDITLNSLPKLATGKADVVIQYATYSLLDEILITSRIGISLQ